MEREKRGKGRENKKEGQGKGERIKMTFFFQRSMSSHFIKVIKIQYLKFIFVIRGYRSRYPLKYCRAQQNYNNNNKKDG